jgi:predicted porin
MKKNIVALAVASAIAAPVAMADAPTVYGKLNQALENYSTDDANGNKDDAQSGQQVNSRASRLGVKGSSDLGNGMKAVYKVEFGVGMSDDDNISNRNQYVGLAGGFGTVLMGRHDTPLKMIQSKDLFNDAYLADNRRFGGELGFGRSGEVRSNNVLAYVSPSFGGVKIIGAVIPKEDDVDSDTDETSGIADTYSLAVAYGSKKEGLYLAGAMNKASDNTQVGDNKHLRLTAQYAMNGLIANAMYQDFSGDGVEDTQKEGKNYMMNLGYKVGKFLPKLKVSKVDRTENAAGTDYEDSTSYAVGVDYSLGKKTTAYAEYAKVEHIDNDAADGSDAEASAFSIGMIHKF